MSGDHKDEPGTRGTADAEGKGHEDISPWEWVVAGASAALVLALIGYLLFLGVSTPSSPPMVSVSRDSVVPMENGYVVTFIARNVGGTTARAVQVEGELRADSGTVEKRSATLHFLPAGAIRRGGLFFEHDPARYRLLLRPEGYDLP